MDKEEPAWRAELEKELAVALTATIGAENIRVRVMARAAILPTIWAAVQAAEERGRREALKEVAAKLREEIEALEPDDNWAVYYRISDVKSLPNLIDPDFS
jgi:hypothetical protein